eukprot:scaffold157558_cov35-Tisochrysis_lutea.AAC.1
MIPSAGDFNKRQLGAHARLASSSVPSACRPQPSPAPSGSVERSQTPETIRCVAAMKWRQPAAAGASSRTRTWR